MSKFSDLKVRVTSVSYASIELPNKSINILLSPELPSDQSLKKSAKEDREKAARLLERADILEAAAEKLAAEKPVIN